MQNEAGEMMDLYIPRKWLITAKDHASVQINIGHLDENGVYTGQYITYALHIPTIGIGAGSLCSGQHEKIMSNPRGGWLLVRFHRLTEAARSAIAVPPMASADGRTSTTGSKRLGLMANVAKRKQSFLQFFLMTGVFMLSMRSLSQKYRIRDLSDENALLRKERDAIALRSFAVKEALFQEAALDPSGLIADHVRSLFDEKPDH